MINFSHVVIWGAAAIYIEVRRRISRPLSTLLTMDRTETNPGVIHEQCHLHIMWMFTVSGLAVFRLLVATLMLNGPLPRLMWLELAVCVAMVVDLLEVCSQYRDIADLLHLARYKPDSKLYLNPQEPWPSDGCCTLAPPVL